MDANAKQSLIQSLFTAGFGVGAFSTQVGGGAPPMTGTSVSISGQMSMSIYPIPKQSGNVTTGQKQNLAAVFTAAGYDYMSMVNQQVWDDVNGETVPGVLAVITPIPAA